MKKSKVKGQSQVIIAILIIVIVLVLIVIVWGVVQNIIQGNLESANTQPFELEADLVYSYGNPGVFRVTRDGTGGGEINEVRLIFSLKNGKSAVYKNDTTFPEELESVTYYVKTSDIGIGGFDEVEFVSVHYGYGNGKVTPELDKGTESFTPLSPSGPVVVPPSCVPDKTCVDYIGQCGIGLDNGCENILDCSGNCGVGEVCEIDNCVLDSVWVVSNNNVCEGELFLGGHECINANDGDVNTPWTTKKLVGEVIDSNIINDFGELKCVSGVKVYSFLGILGLQTANIKVSENNIDWVEVQNSWGLDTEHWNEIEFNEVKARYVRLSFTDCPHELDIGGINHHLCQISEYKLKVRDNC
ncbi:discoidin domain-containing protein [archaeon]|jgi:hypothetical protein|nr:discoidin domain-containing protein [archaeon]MBT4241568.1 discoidin domain-containing protein [archaeon]MBT4417963.1 discoidin domain-containing protein [archaeon]